MELTHVNEKGKAKMVDVSAKPIQHRTAVAQGTVMLEPQTVTLLKENMLKKGDALATARIAGIMSAKRCAELIPLCHPIAIGAVDIDFQITAESVHIIACVKSCGKTGVEMEALTAVSGAALTIYDMCKAVDKKMVITNIHLVNKKKEAIA